MPHAVLIVEDEKVLAGNIQLYLQHEGFEARVAPSLREGLRQLEAFEPDVILLDLALPDGSGLDLLTRVRAQDAQAKVVVMTGHGSVQVAVDAMKAGACDYVSKPIALGEIKLTLERALGQGRMEGTLLYYHDRTAQRGCLTRMLGESPAMLELKRAINCLLDAERNLIGEEPPAPVLVRGETGSGKELVAAALHFAGSRAQRPFMEVNCAALPANLLEGELFGHERGAFTDARERRIGLVEAAHGGTLFLDEIGDIDAAVQVKLLRLLEDRTVRRLGSVRERQVNVRFVFATHRPLEELVREERFRSDLYFRLRVATLDVPPLRERGDDVLLLARHFLALSGQRYGKPRLQLSAEAQALLLRHPWPGNVRELRNAMEQAALSTEGGMVGAVNLALAPPALMSRRQEMRSGTADPEGEFGGTLHEVEQRAVDRAMERSGGNVSRAARELGISRDILRHRLGLRGAGPSRPQR